MAHAAPIRNVFTLALHCSLCCCTRVSPLFALLHDLCCFRSGVAQRKEYLSLIFRGPAPVPLPLRATETTLTNALEPFVSLTELRALSQLQCDTSGYAESSLVQSFFAN